MPRVNLSTEVVDKLYFPSRVEREIQKLRQRISEGDENNRNHSVSSDERTSHSSSPVSHIQSLNSLLPLSDDRYTLWNLVLTVYIHRETPAPAQLEALSLSWPHTSLMVCLFIIDQAKRVH